VLFSERSKHSSASHHPCGFRITSSQRVNIHSLLFSSTASLKSSCSKGLSGATAGYHKNKWHFKQYCPKCLSNRCADQLAVTPVRIHRIQRIQCTHSFQIHLVHLLQPTYPPRFHPKYSLICFIQTTPLMNLPHSNEPICPTSCIPFNSFSPFYPYSSPYDVDDVFSSPIVISIDHLQRGCFLLDPPPGPLRRRVGYGSCHLFSREEGAVHWAAKCASHTSGTSQ
jgi:hypothetical protein